MWLDLWGCHALRWGLLFLETLLKSLLFLFAKCHPAFDRGTEVFLPVKNKVEVAAEIALGYLQRYQAATVKGVNEGNAG